LNKANEQIIDIINACKMAIYCKKGDFYPDKDFGSQIRLSKNINEIMKTEDESKQKELALASNKILEEIIEIDSDILEDDEDGEVIETTTKFEFNLGFAKVSRNIKKIKK
jgi:hypothetical protein